MPVSWKEWIVRKQTMKKELTESKKQEIQPRKEAEGGAGPPAAQEVWRGIHLNQSRRAENEGMSPRKKRKEIYRLPDVSEFIERRFLFLLEILWIHW